MFCAAQFASHTVVVISKFWGVSQCLDQRNIFFFTSKTLFYCAFLNFPYYTILNPDVFKIGIDCNYQVDDLEKESRKKYSQCIFNTVLHSQDTGRHNKNITHSLLQGNSPTLKYWPHPSLPVGPPKKILNLSDLPTPLLWASPLKILENLTPSLKLYPCSKKKRLIF